MFEALVITLREGVEAALVLSIALALLRRRGLDRLRGPLFAGFGVALLASVVVAWLATRLTWNEELAEGVVMLAGAVLVFSLVWWMWKSGPNMKREVEEGLERATGGAVATFLFAFGMTFREGVETALFLSAAGFNTDGLRLWLGAGLGLAIATVFGVMFARGAVRVPLKPFFSLTTAILVLIGVQLVVGGLHELSEAGVLPATRQSMALIGPVVKNELLLFTLTVALAAGWLLFGPGLRAERAPAAAASGPEARLAAAATRRDARLRRVTGTLGLIVVVFLTTAFVQQSNIPGRAPAERLTATDGVVSFELAPLEDGAMRFYEVARADSAQAPFRFFAVKTPNGVQTCFDACEICGDMGYFQDGVAVVCRNCTSPIVLGTLGRGGGCNPIPLPSSTDGARRVVATADLEAVLPYLEGH